jgi:hypothetical protein
MVMKFDAIKTRELELRRQRLNAQKQLSQKRVQSQKQPIKNKVLPNEDNQQQYDASKTRELELRRQRLNSEKQVSNKKVQAQQQVRQPSVDFDNGLPEKDFEEQERDNEQQIKIASENVLKLVKNKNEAYTLLDMLVEHYVIYDFNINFPRILRELQTNFKNLGANRAFTEIIKIINKEEAPLNTSSFLYALESLYDRIKRDNGFNNGSDNGSDSSDDLNKVEAVMQTYENLDDEGKRKLEDAIDIQQSAETVLDEILDVISTKLLEKVYNEHKEDGEDEDENEIKETGVEYKDEDFTTVLKEVYKEVKKENEDDAQKVEAVLETYESVDDEGKRKLESAIDISDDMQNMLDNIYSAVEQKLLDEVYDEFNSAINDDSFIDGDVVVNNETFDATGVESLSKDTIEYIFETKDNDAITRIASYLGTEGKYLKGQYTKNEKKYDAGSSYIYDKIQAKKQENEKNERMGKY